MSEFHDFHEYLLILWHSQFTKINLRPKIKKITDLIAMCNKIKQCKNLFKNESINFELKIWGLLLFR